MHAVIIESDDGTVTVNGPYAEREAALRAARKIATDFAANEEHREMELVPDGAIVTGGSIDQIDVYVRLMGEPLEGSVVDLQMAATVHEQLLRDPLNPPDPGEFKAELLKAAAE